MSLLTADAFGSRAGSLVEPSPPLPPVSDFAAAKFASAVSRMVRTGEASKAAADSFLRQLDLPLRAPDAIRIATARRPGADLATFDAKMASCARALGLNVIPA